MAYVEGFEHDIFLSYARVDDETAAEAERGWVSAFERYLQVALDKRVGRIGAVRIWRDVRRIRGNQLFDRTIREALDTTAAFVALTSNGYLASEFCRQEVAYFHRKATADAIGLAAGDRLRIVNVLLTSVDHRDRPEEYDETAGFALHDATHDDPIGRPSEPGSGLFKRQLRHLVDALYELLDALKKTTSQSAPAGRDTPSIIFLGDVADPLRDQRRSLAHDLEQLGHRVIADIPPPDEATAHDQRVIAAVREAALSVHLLDASAGREIGGPANQTYPRRQVELAIDNGSAQMVWIPRELDLETLTDRAQRAFLDRLQSGLGSAGSYDFIRCPSADLTALVDERANEIRRASATAAGADPAACLLVTQAKDTVHVLSVAEALVSRGIAPFINQEAKEPELLMQLFEERIRQVASLIVFFGRVSRAWVQERLDSAVKIAAMEALDLKLGVYAAPPEKSPRDYSFSRGFISVQTLRSEDEVLRFVGGTA